MKNTPKNKTTKPTYKAKENIRFNDIPLHDQLVTVVCECNSDGKTKDSAGKPIKKKDKTHYKLKFTDKKWLKTHRLDLSFSTFIHSKHDLDRFFVEVSPETLKPQTKPKTKSKSKSES